MTFPMARIYIDANTTLDPQAADRFLVPTLFPPEPPTGFDPAVYMKREDQLTFTRIYKMDFVPSGLFAEFMVRALTLAAPVHYWRDGAVLSLAMTNTAAYIHCDNVTCVQIAVTGQNAHRLLLHLDHALQALASHVFQIGMEMFALCNCQACGPAPEKAHQWRVSDLITAYLNSNQLTFKCSSNDVSLKR
jgi:hypothetical protein